MSCTNADATAQALENDIIRHADALDRSIRNTCAFSG